MPEHYYTVSDYDRDWFRNHQVVTSPPFCTYTRKLNMLRAVQPDDVVWLLTRHPLRGWSLAGKLIVEEAVTHDTTSISFDRRWKEFTVQFRMCREKSKYFEPLPIGDEEDPKGPTMLGLLESFKQKQKQMCQVRGDFSELVVSYLQALAHGATELKEHKLGQR